jgi:hypothetical protein
MILRRESEHEQMNERRTAKSAAPRAYQLRGSHNLSQQLERRRLPF